MIGPGFFAYEYESIVRLALNNNAEMQASIDKPRLLLRPNIDRKSHDSLIINFGM